MNTNPLDDKSWEFKLSRRVQELAKESDETREMVKALILALNNLNQRLTKIEIQLSELAETKRLNE